MTQFGVAPRQNGSKFFPEPPPKARYVPPTLAPEPAPAPKRAQSAREDILTLAVQAALDRPPIWPMEAIAREVADKHGLSSWHEMRSKRRDWKLVIARWECWYRCSQETPQTCTAIARYFGVDHTTVSHGRREYERRYLPVP